MIRTGLAALPMVTISEARAYVRLDEGDEDALLAGLVRTASALCEEFTGQLGIERDVVEDVAVGADWCRLSLSPVRRIDKVELVAPNGAVSGLAPSTSFAVDIDANGDGWIRSVGTSEVRTLRVSGRAGVAASESDLPEPLRQGVLRLVAHLFTRRDGDDGEPPMAVTALWRPYRRMRLS